MPEALIDAARQLEQIQKPEANIVEDVGKFIRRFVFFRDDVFYYLVSAWIIDTYLKESFDYVGYIFAYSPEPQSGKTRLLEVLDLLVDNSSSILVSPTEAVLFRTAGGTQLIDEMDSCGKREDLRSILNQGFQRNGVVLRMGEAEGTYKPERHKVYAPRALAGIGSRILHVATRDRTFMFEMVRQTRDERREKFRIRKIQPEADALKTRISEWVKANKERVETIYNQSEFAYLEELRDRTIDIVQPLATIIEVAYAGSAKRRMALSRLIRAVTLTRGEDRAAQDQHKVVRQLLQIADSEEPLIGSATELSEMCAKLLVADPPGQGLISSTLRTYGFETKSHRKDGGEPRQRYELSKAKLREILERYDPEWVPEGETAGEKPGVLEMGARRVEAENDDANV